LKPHKHLVFTANHFTDESDLPFNPADYSRFKYGSKDIARKFGQELANKFIKSPNFHKYYQQLVDGMQIVVITSPYMYIPTATYAMKDYFVAELNDMLIDLEINPVQESKIYRTLSYNADYGAMTLEDRRLAISGDEFHIDRDFVKGKLVLFVDDIKITGAHEERVQSMVDRLKLNCDYMYLYYAKLDNPETQPQIENFLNYYAIKDLLDINKIIKDEDFIYNTRVVKYILNASHDQCKPFLDYQSSTFKSTLYRYAIGNGYHKMPEFEKNLKYLRKLIK
jgi:hypothetical protein